MHGITEERGSQDQPVPCFSCSTHVTAHPQCGFGGSQGNPSCGVCSLCSRALPLRVCHGAGIGASMCHLPLAPEEKEMEQALTGVLQHVVGMDPITPKARDTFEIKTSLLNSSFFEHCTWCQQIDLSTALSWTNLWKMNYLQKKVKQICKLKGSGEAQISQLECEGPDLGPLLERVVEFTVD